MSEVAKRIQLVSKALDLAKQLMDFAPEDHHIILAELAFVLCLDSEEVLTNGHGRVYMHPESAGRE